MNWLKRQRIKQIIKYGWNDSAKVSKECHKGRLFIFYDIVYCFYKYYVFSNQYVVNKLWSVNEREQLAKTIGSANKKHDDWGIDNYKNRKFIKKWSSLKWGNSKKKVRLRNKAYAKQFNAGDGFSVQHHVDIHREHFLEGTISIGKNVLFAKNVFVDYSGELIIHDGVALANGVIIETHTHDIHNDKGIGIPIPNRLEIGENAKILSRAYIADTCHSIGRYARIGAGSYVRTNIPPYAIVMGNPAKIIGFLYSPEEMAAFEEKIYPEKKRTSVEKYSYYYEKYFKSRTKEIKSFIKL